MRRPSLTAAMPGLLLLLAGCEAPSAPQPQAAEPEKTEPLRLYLWLHGADDLVPSQLEGRAAKRQPPSARALAEAAFTCGRSEFQIGGDALSGQEVSLPSGADDRKLVMCVQARIGFGFNATVAPESDWNSRHTGAGTRLEVD